MSKKTPNNYSYTTYLRNKQPHLFNQIEHTNLKSFNIVHKAFMRHYYSYTTYYTIIMTVGPIPLLGLFILKSNTLE